MISENTKEENGKAKKGRRKKGTGTKAERREIKPDAEAVSLCRKKFV